MKRVLFVLLCIMLVLSVQSCSDKVESATLRVEMDKSVRTLSPLIENMEIHQYHLTAYLHSMLQYLLSKMMLL